MNRVVAFGRSMPRKSKHGQRISRWDTHREIKASQKGRRREAREARPELT